MPQRTLAIEISLKIVSFDSHWHLNFQVSKLEYKGKRYRRSKWIILFSLNDHISPNRMTWSFPKGRLLVGWDGQVASIERKGNGVALITHQHFFWFELRFGYLTWQKDKWCGKGTTPKKTLGHFYPKFLELGRNIYKYCVFSLDYPHTMTHQIRIKQGKCFYWTLHFYDPNKVATLVEEEDLLLFQPCGVVWALKWWLGIFLYTHYTRHCIQIVSPIFICLPQY